MLRLISKIVHDLSSRFPDYAISPRTRKGGGRKKRKKKIRKRRRRMDSEWSSCGVIETQHCTPWILFSYPRTCICIYIYIRGWTHGARTIMRTGCYKYSIRCSNLLVDEVIIPGLTGSTGAWYSSNGNKTRVEQRWATWTDGQPCEYAGFEYAPVRMHTRVAYVYS